MKLAICAMACLLAGSVFAQEPKPASTPVQSGTGQSEVEATMDINKNLLAEELKAKLIPITILVKNNSNEAIVINPACDSQSEGVVVYAVSNTGQRTVIYPVIKDAPPRNGSTLIIVVAPGKMDGFTICVPISLIDPNQKEIICGITAMKAKSKAITAEILTNALQISKLPLK